MQHSPKVPCVDGVPLCCTVESLPFMGATVQNDNAFHSPVDVRSINSSVFSLKNSREDFKFSHPPNFSALG